MGGEQQQQRAEVIRRWLAAIEESVAAADVAPAETPDVPGSSRDDSRDAERVRVGAHLAAAECPASVLGPSEEFRDSARTAAREIALETLRRNPSRSDASAGGRNPIAEVTSVLDDTTVFRPGLARWLDELDRAERSAAVAAAVSWMVDALALAARRAEPMWHSPTHRSRKLGSAPVTIAARVDASRVTRSGTHLLVLSPGARRSDERLARRVALVSAAAFGEVATQVHIGHRDTLSRYGHRVDEEQLDRAVEEVTEDIRWTLRPSTAPRVPGRSCRWCALAEDCPEGTAHLHATRGSPVPSWLVPEPVVPSRPGGAAQESSAGGVDPTM